MLLNSVLLKEVFMSEVCAYCRKIVYRGRYYMGKVFCDVKCLIAYLFNKGGQNELEKKTEEAERKV